ncbi:MAG TPA: GNAT family N-acetyltransferase, partial [Acidimicrobiales bacterium]
MTLQFRVVDARDADAIAVLRNYLLEVASTIPDAVVSEAEAQDVDDFTPPSGRFVLVVDGERVVGGGAVRRLDEITAEVKRMWVAGEERGTGLGSALLSELERQ